MGGVSSQPREAEFPQGGPAPRKDSGAPIYRCVSTGRNIAMIRWRRIVPGSDSNFDLELDGSLSPGERAEIGNLLDSIDAEGKLDESARNEFRRWLDRPDTPLRSTAYALLSNWFLSTPRYSNTAHAQLCEALWNALFPCRPPERFTLLYPDPNYAIMSIEFEAWWQAVEARYQG